MVVKKVLIISGRTDVSVRNIKQQIVDNHGHSFTKKTFNCPRPIYCHHCLDLLNWKLINNGLNCEGEINLTSCDYLLQVTSWQEPKPKETVFQFLIRRALFIAHIILISTEFKDWDLQFIQIDIKYCIQNFQMVDISSDTLHICVFFLSNQFFSNHDKNIFLSTKVFFYFSEYLGTFFSITI